MQHLFKLLKGIAIGIANIIPGFSGGTMAVIVKIYDEFVDALANITKHPLQVLRKSWSLFVGIFLGLVIGFVGVVKLLEVAPLITVLFFFGLVLGSIPQQAQLSIQKPFVKKTLIPFFVSMVLIILLPILAGLTSSNVEEVSFITYIIVFLLGIVAAAAMVLPGLSGSMILLIFGYYHLVVNSIKNIAKGFLHFEFTGLSDSFLILLALIVGVVLGVIFMSKLVKHLYSKFPVYCNMAVLGLLIASLFAILYSSNVEYNGALFQVEAWRWVVGIAVALAGTAFTFCVNFKAKKKELQEVVAE